MFVDYKRRQTKKKELTKSGMYCMPRNHKTKIQINIKTRKNEQNENKKTPRKQRNSPTPGMRKKRVNGGVYVYIFYQV